jgi:uncharacterized protein YbjT (DUF2867 family)
MAEVREGEPDNGSAPPLMPGPRSVLVLGATGLVGAECLRLMLHDDAFSRVVALTRRPLSREGLSLKLENRVVNFDEMAAHADAFEVDQIICALGTTLRKTPSREQYRAIDFGYPLTAARLGLEKGTSHYLLVSAIGANSRSRLFYNRLKGELEDAIKALPFRSITIVQPSVLSGERAEPRLSEKIAWRLSFLTPRKYRPVDGASVARALVNSARADEPGLRVIENRDLERAAGN